MTEATEVGVAQEAVAKLRVGFIGLGSQGAPMARRIIEGGYPTTLWARRPQSLEPYADTPAVIAATAAELASGSDLVCVCVVDDAGVEAVLTGPDGVLSGLAPGGIVAIHSTVHPATCVRMGELAAERGIAVVDAPVSGGAPAAVAGRLVVMAGGAPEVFARCEPVFRTYGDPVVHLGELGTGEVAKLLNNMSLAAQLEMSAGILDIAGSLGLDPRALGDVVAKGTGASYAMSLLGQLGGSLAALSGSAGPLLRKDVRILAELLGDGDVSRGLVWSAADGALGRLGHPRVG
ncbi:NAD(P)-dependent oxidoreductase [Nocardia bovistercoris]|uniref:NAD(P)-dependent oxidoreductase n=1 Tax=Nocardia bovistercoris TaxID=2785916 RepID=A0A931IHM4_9NOCA|nr:NAD(P)-dependent oxidoreductase [Nocardia bovistercoris]MBH0779793.1 NAD(P)-dependent oxidoreductase [Nocardia bovistercoris]